MVAEQATWPGVKADQPRRSYEGRGLKAGPGDGAANRQGMGTMRATEPTGKNHIRRADRLSPGVWLSKVLEVEGRAAAQRGESEG